MLTPDELSDEEKVLLKKRLTEKMAQGKTLQEVCQPEEVAKIAEEIVRETRGEPANSGQGPS